MVVRSICRSWTDVKQVHFNAMYEIPSIFVKNALEVELNDGLDDEIVTTEPSVSVVVLSVTVKVIPELFVEVVVHS